MNQLQEIELKHNQIRALLETHKLKGLWLRRTRNIAWFTAGADAAIPVNNEMGAYSVLVTAEKRTIFGNNIELTRLRDEEPFEALGFDSREFPWYASQTADFPGDDGSLEEALQQFRCVLTEGEQTRFRQLGRDAADAIEEAARAVRPGETEFEIAARLDAACRKRGGTAIVNLIGTDDRILKYRHPVPTAKKLDKVALLVVCMRRGGLVAAASRMVHFGAIPAELAEKLHQVAAVDAAAIHASRPGRTLGEIFEIIRNAYEENQEGGQWKNHHQGGLIAYLPRERLALPDSPLKLQMGHALAWNPSVAGCKSEDTILVGQNSYDIVTHSISNWPMVRIELDGQLIPRPGILRL